MSASPALAVRIRPAWAPDVADLQAIYAHHVRTGLASFEEEPPTLDEMHRRFDDITRLGLPWLVAESNGGIAGYAYCAPYRARPAYRYTLEDTVYVREGLARRGIGRALLAQLIVQCEALGYRQLIAVIGDSANLASIGLHANQGFLRVGVLRSAGWKFGRWVDSVIMQRALGDGDGRPPA